MSTQRLTRYLAIIGFLALLAVGSAMAAVVPRQLPEGHVKFFVKDVPYQDSLRELFKLTKYKVQFTEDVKVDKNVSVDVQKVRWTVLFGAILDSYNMGHRFVGDDTVEIYKK